ncbi:hypothetical protein Tco_1220078 [Tanacetum coccineum]
MLTAEAEYVSLSACCAQVIWMRTQRLDYGYRYTKIPMYCDSKSEIAISCNPVQHSRTKHINIRYHFIKEHVEQAIIMEQPQSSAVQQITPFDQLIHLSKFQTVKKFNNMMVLLNIPCPKECRIVGQLLVHHDLNYALIATAEVPAVYIKEFWKTVRQVPNHNETIYLMVDKEEITYTVDMFRASLKLPVEAPKHPFIPLADFNYIQPFLRFIGYQGPLDKVSAFFTKNLAQPWQTMFKVFNICLTSRLTGHDQTKINVMQIFHAILKKVNVDYASLQCITDIMDKYESIPKRFEEDYHTIKDDTSDYEVKHRGLEVPTIQPKPVESTQGTNRTPRATRTPNPDDVVQKKKGK